MTGTVAQIAKVLVAAIALPWLVQSQLARAEPYPSKPIRLIVPFSPGGSTDILARLIAPRLGKALGQSVIVETRAGAASIIGTQLVARATPDGYTLLLTNVAYAINPAIRGKNLAYDPQEFIPISLLASQPTVLVVNSELAVNSVADVIALAKKHPGEMKFASAGIGSVGHMAGAMFEAETGTKMVHIPYQGGGTAVIDVVSGHVMMGFLGMPPMMPYTKTGKVKFLALTDGKRSAAAPDVATLGEQGLAGFSVDNWIGLLAPAQTPPDIVARLFNEVAKIMGQPDVAESLKAIGFEAWVSKNPAAFRDFLERDIAKYKKAAEAAHITID
jgi:tripartite-type tricarboxylate transporter receptor subunit TctC